VPTPDQQAVYNTVAAQWRGGLSFALEAGTGFGKTAVACKLALDFVRGRISTGSAGAVAAKHEAGELFTGPLVAGTKSASSGFVEKMPDTDTSVSIPVSRLRVGIFTRTNNQVGNIADEFERVALGEHQHKSPPSVVCLASRRELCLVPGVADVEDYTAGRRACLAEDCSYRDVKAPHLRTTHPLTTKLLKALGEKHHFCPYYAAKGLGSKADVVVASYPYFFGQGSAVGKLRLVIVDEAHNIRNASYKEVALSALKDDTHPASAVVQKKWADIPGGALEWPKEVGQEFVTALAQNSAAEAESDVFYELATLAAEKETKLVAKFLPTANYGKVVASPKLCFQHSPAIEDVRFQALEQRGGLALLMSGTLFTNPFADSLAQALPQGCTWACLRAPKPFRRKFVQISYGLDFAEFPDPTHKAEVRFLSTLLDK
jgi:Rad3-related DNA helicase